MREMLLDDTERSTVPLVHTLKDMLECLIKQMQGLLIMLFNSHIEVQSGILCQMPMSVTVLGTENWIRFQVPGAGLSMMRLLEGAFVSCALLIQLDNIPRSLEDLFYFAP